MVHNLPKNCLLKKTWQYEQVYQKGKRIRGPGINLIFLGNDIGIDRLGISISGVKLAVKRNRIKRLIKEFFRLNRHLPSKIAGKAGQGPGVDLIIAATKNYNPNNISDISKTLTPFIKDLSSTPVLQKK